MGCGGSKSKPEKKQQVQEDIVTFQNFINECTKQPQEDYKLGKMLGEGTYGVVIRCEHKITGDVRAMKKIPKKAISREEQRMKMVNDILILRQLSHPSIMKLYEFYQDEQNYYIISEFIKGGELFDRFEKLEKLSEREAANVMKQILGAIKYCHRQGICHRDLKPENIMIEQSEQSKGDYDIKIIDWGCAKKFGKEKLTDLVGTPYYLAPEVIQRSYNEKVDIWSLGAILYTLLTGQPPFTGETAQQVMEKVAKGIWSMEGKIWNTISNDAKDLISHMMQVNPELRYSADQALQHKWIKSAPERPIDEDIRALCKQNIQKFRARSKLQNAVLQYIVSQIITKDNQAHLEKVFKSMDKNNDGTISKDELKQYFENQVTQERLDQIMNMADSNQNGMINYNEFLAAFLDTKQLTSEEVLKQAFAKLDTDGNGYIDADEMAVILKAETEYQKGDAKNDIAWQNLLQQVDANGDGKISFEEFKAMISKAV